MGTDEETIEVLKDVYDKATFYFEDRLGKSNIEKRSSGIRQGCPLSPVLYLVVGQALASWLRAQPQLGVVAGGERFVSSHLADDSNVFTSLSAEAQAALLAALATFGEASGQRINVDKSKALLIGAPLPPVAPGVEGTGILPEHVLRGVSGDFFGS